MAKGDTHFGGLVYSMGVPTVGGGGIPLTFGKYYFVDARVGSDGKTGTSMDRAFKTVLVGYNAMGSGKNDVLVLSADTAHAITAQLVVAKNNVHFVGLGISSRYFGQGTRFEMASGGSANSGIVKNTGKRNSFSGIKFFNTDSSTSFAVVDAGEFSQWNYCEMVNTQGLGTVTDAHLLCIADSPHYNHCTFGSSQSGHQFTAARGCVLFDRTVISGKVCRDAIFEECLIVLQSTNTGASGFLLTGAVSIERVLWVKGCMFWGTKLSGTIDRAIQVDNDQTDGDILCDQDCTVHGITALVDDSLTTVYHGKTGAATDTAMAALLGGA